MPKFTNRSVVGGLLLNRKEGQTIEINHGEVIIEVVEIKNHQVRLAFKAARDVLIRRGEINHAEDKADAGQVRPG